MIIEITITIISFLLGIGIGFRVGRRIRGNDNDMDGRDFTSNKETAHQSATIQFIPHTSKKEAFTESNTIDDFIKML